MELVFFKAEGWESWGLEHKPVIPDGMPVLIDSDLCFEDAPASPRPLVAANRWLRELPSSGCPEPGSWGVYARAVRDWAVFLDDHGIGLFDDRARLKAALSSYAVHRSSGPLEVRFAATTWNQHVSILSSFYRWAVEEKYANAEPFTYRQATVFFADQTERRMVNQAARRVPKPHVTIKYLEGDFAELFLRGLRGLGPNGEDDRFRGRELARNGAVGGAVLDTGLRLQEFTYYLAAELPPLPPKPTALPIPFPVASGIAKGRKFRTTWITYDKLAELHHYCDVDRVLATEGAAWRPPSRWGSPLLVSETDQFGGRINGRRICWEGLRPVERRRLVAPDGGAMLLAVRADGGPFTAWPTVFARTAARIRDRFEPRFPHVHPHRLRHTFSIATLARLVSGYYHQAAQLVRDTDAEAGLALYLAKADPLIVLRDLLGHTSVLTTEKYLRRLDMTRIFRDAYEQAGRDHGLISDAEAQREADAEFDEDEGDLW
ncbi:site-specific integrase [Streptomyces spectabilis]|uniref:Integrase n=1 Tax=Streptomyces spectabilis TaxID=68270 RepID=A0A7W8EZV3_STRST|nr:site-specific integrase [Streptomyces spectabilis]MBB5109589.1 integrase [Streptomyces spectabilis]GGV54702.1 integrase [Streptomyces spectabilis]